MVAVATASVFAERPVLYPFQEELLAELRDRFGRERRICLQLPTGGGKTVLCSEFLSEVVAEGGRVLFLAHRRELITQCSRKLGSFGLPHGIIMAGIEPDPAQRTQVASIQTLVRREVPRVDLLVIDEAHHVKALSYLEVIKACDAKRLLGLTATPRRADGSPLSDVFDSLILGPSIESLVALSYLSPFIVYAPDKPDLTGIRTVAGDYEQGRLAERMSDARIVASVVGTWKARAADRQTLVFAVNVRHSEQLAAAFRDAGVRAAHIDAETPLEVRKKLLREFSNREIQVLTNCQIFVEGYDSPAVGCIVLARPTKSIVLYLQAVGRGSRTAPGKTDCMLLDHSGNVYQHGLPADDRLWTLTGSEHACSSRNSEGTVTKICPSCGYVVANTFYGQCPGTRINGDECTYVFEEPARPKPPVEAPGELHEVKPGSIDSDSQKRLEREFNKRHYAAVYAHGRQHPNRVVRELWEVAERFGLKPGYVWYQCSERGLLDEYNQHCMDYRHLRKLAMRIGPQSAHQWRSTGT